MMTNDPPDFRFCPFCGQALAIKIEEQKQRRYCQSCGWTYYPRVAASVTGVVLRGNKILLVKRLRDPFRGTWMFPSGFVDFGEHPEEALARELMEETGLVLDSAELLGIFQSPDDPRELGHFVFFYLAHVKFGDVRTDPHENEAIDWFDIHDVPEIAWVLHREILSKIRGTA